MTLAVDISRRLRPVAELSNKSRSSKMQLNLGVPMLPAVRFLR